MSGHALRAALAREPESGAIDPLVARWRACEHPRAPLLVIAPGTRADLEALAPFHYASARTGPLARVLVAHDQETGERAGVLGVGMPTLNATWRRRVWPDLCESPDPRVRALRLNGSVRTIVRVIVEPRWRAMRVGTALVRAYLREPLTERTEALATSMRAFLSRAGDARDCARESGGGLFERAGMRRVEVPRPARDWPLLDALDALGASPASLLDPIAREELMRSDRFRRALGRWLRASRATRALADGPLDRACAPLIRALLAPPVVLIHECAAVSPLHDPAQHRADSHPSRRPHHERSNHDASRDGDADW